MLARRSGGASEPGSGRRDDHGLTVGDGSSRRARSSTVRSSRWTGICAGSAAPPSVLRSARRPTSASGGAVGAACSAAGRLPLGRAADHCHRRGRARSAPIAADGSDPGGGRRRGRAVARQITVVTVPWTRNETRPWPGRRPPPTPRTWSRSRAHAHGAHEALLANTRGLLCEGTGSNVVVERSATGCSPRRCRRGAWQGSPGSCCWSGPRRRASPHGGRRPPR